MVEVQICEVDALPAPFNLAQQWVCLVLLGFKGYFTYHHYLSVVRLRHRIFKSECQRTTNDGRIKEVSASLAPLVLPMQHK
jgi:hypothetical protein